MNTADLLHELDAMIDSPYYSQRKLELAQARRLIVSAGAERAQLRQRIADLEEDARAHLARALACAESWDTCHYDGDCGYQDIGADIREQLKLEGPQ